MNECDSSDGFLGQEFPQTSWRPETQAVPGYQSRHTLDKRKTLQSLLFSQWKICAQSVNTLTVCSYQTIQFVDVLS